MTYRLRSVRLFMALSVLIPATFVAQIPAPPPEPYHPQRFLVVGNVVFEGQWQPITAVGGLWQISLQKTRVQRDELGATLVTPPRWYLHTLLSGGAAFDPPESSKTAAFTAYGELGAVRRNDSPITASGVTLHTSSTPRSIGSAFRFEVMDNLGVKLGLTYIRGKSGPRVMVSVDYFKKLCEDLGFGMVC